LTKVVWSPSSVRDLQSLRGYIDQFNPRAARDIAARLFEAGSSLRKFPGKGRPVGDNLREWTLVYPYIIRYEIVGDDVHILGIRHG